MTIEELSKMPLGKEHRTGGFRLTVKRQRSVREHGKKYLQEILWMDDTGEIAGEILLPKRIPLQNNANIHITICWLQQGEKGPKLYVEQWTPVTMTELDVCTQRANFNDEIQYGEPLPVIKSKVRMHVVCSHRRWHGLDEKLTQEQKSIANDDVDFIMTGESDG